jgi:hypothetical protein
MDEPLAIRGDMKQKYARPMRLTVAAIVAIVFGGLTILSGGMALFGKPEARAIFGDIVQFVLWFNFAAGFAYVIAGAGLFHQCKWAVWLSGLIALGTGCVFFALALHIFQGGVYEMRTVAAMTLRTAVWIGITIVAARCIPDETPVA